jgi:hypothetical protein
LVGCEENAHCPRTPERRHRSWRLNGSGIHPSVARRLGGLSLGAKDLIARR